MLTMNADSSFGVKVRGRRERMAKQCGWRLCSTLNLPQSCILHTTQLRLSMDLVHLHLSVSSHSWPIHTFHVADYRYIKQTLCKQTSSSVRHTNANLCVRNNKRQSSLPVVVVVSAAVVVVSTGVVVV